MKLSVITPATLRMIAVTISMIAGAKLSFELMEVPGTLQTFFLCLTALYMAPGHVLTGQLLYLLLGLFLPVFASEEYGADVFLGSTAGYLYAFPLAAWLMSRKVNKGDDWFLVFSWCISAHFIVLSGGFLWAVLYKKVSLATGLFSFVLHLLPWAFLKSAMVTGLYLVAEILAKRRDQSGISKT